MRRSGLSQSRQEALNVDPSAVTFKADVSCLTCGTFDVYVKGLTCCQCSKSRSANKPKKGMLIGSRYYTESGQDKVWLTNKDLESIIRMREDKNMSMVAIAEKLGVTRGTIWAFLAKKSHARFYEEKGVSIAKVDDVQAKALQLMTKKRA